MIYRYKELTLNTKTFRTPNEWYDLLSLIGKHLLHLDQEISNAKLLKNLYGKSMPQDTWSRLNKDYAQEIYQYTGVARAFAKAYPREAHRLYAAEMTSLLAKRYPKIHAELLTEINRFYE